MRLYWKRSVSSMSCVSQSFTASCTTVTGPLNSTVRDFWQMVVEQGSTLVVMVTTLVERGRTKCHKYWPALGETLELLSLQLTCNKEEADSTGSFVFREFILRDLLVSWDCSSLWSILFMRRIFLVFFSSTHYLETHFFPLKEVVSFDDWIDINLSHT